MNTYWLVDRCVDSEQLSISDDNVMSAAASKSTWHSAQKSPSKKNRRRFCTTDFVSTPLFCSTPESGYSKIRQQACGCGQFAQKCREPFFSHFFPTGWSIFRDGQPTWVSVRCSLMGAYNSQRFLVFNSRCSDSGVGLLFNHPSVAPSVTFQHCVKRLNIRKNSLNAWETRQSYIVLSKLNRRPISDGTFQRGV